MMYWRLGILLLAAPISSIDLATPALSNEADDLKGGDSDAQSSAAPIVMSLLQELRLEASRSQSQAGSMLKWCRSAKELNEGLIDVVKRQLGAADIAAHQLGLESKRSLSEEQLAKLTVREKEQQLRDAVLTLDVASEEFKDEQSQVAATLQATRRALHIAQVRRKAAAHKDSATSHTDDASAADSAFLTLNGQAAGMPSQDLPELLKQLQGELDREQSSALQEHSAMQRRFWVFADHLNSSLVETQSQVAAIKTEVAQRKREQARLDGRRADLSALFADVQVVAAATESVCIDNERQEKQLLGLIVAEAKVASALLRQLHAVIPLDGSVLDGQDGSDAHNSSSVLELGSLANIADAAEPPPSFLQASSAATAPTSHVRRGSKASGEDVGVPGSIMVVKEAAEHEQQADELGQYLLHADSGGNGNDAMNNALHDIEQFVKVDTTMVEAVGDPSTSALRNIKQFVSDRAAADATARKALESQETLEREQALADRRSAKRQRWCASIQQDGRADAGALDRSSKRLRAKLDINRATALEYERELAYDQNQYNQMAAQLRQLAGLAEGLKQQTQRATKLLNRHAEQLVAVASDLSQQSGSTEQSAAQDVRELAQKVDNHQDALQQRYRGFLKLRATVETADRATLKQLLGNMEVGKRRLTRLDTEAQVLSALARAKVNTQVITKHYEELVTGMCAEVKTKESGD
mmetsp:Transcript_29032/g.67538  ORF Transcript_29032/g.67538 Transcript_29032/m.67538 type:complete len:700 (-) Transcript_29032:134-2233(-)